MNNNARIGLGPGRRMPVHPDNLAEFHLQVGRGRSTLQEILTGHGLDRLQVPVGQLDQGATIELIGLVGIALGLLRIGTATGRGCRRPGR